MCCQIYISPSKLQDSIPSGTLQYRLPTWNSTTFPITTRNRNSTWVGAVHLAVSKMLCVRQSYAKIYIHGNGVRLLHPMHGQNM